MAGELIRISDSMRIYFNFGTFLKIISAHRVSLLMHQNLLIIPSGKTKALFVQNIGF